MISGPQVIAALQAYDEELHGKSGTLGERVVAMLAALEAAQASELKAAFRAGHPTIMECWAREQEIRA